MSRILLFPAFVRLSFQRMASRPMLTLLSLFGVALAVGLLTSAAFFSQAVDRVVLAQELHRLTTQTGRPPFTTRVYFLPSARFPVGVATAEMLGEDVADTLASEVGLRVARQGLSVASGGLMLLPPPGDTRYASGQSHLKTVDALYMAGIADHLLVDAGDPFNEADALAEDVLDVWMHVNLAAEIGAQVGEQFQLAVNMRQAPRPIRIRGLWQASDPTDRFWFNNPNTTLRNALLVTRNSYIAVIEPMVAAKSGFVNWHIALDEDQVNPAYARRYADGFERGMAVINQYLPAARLDVSPLESLKLFVRRQATLTLVLLGFNVPGLAILLYFLVLVALIIARAQERETALLVSRGMTLMQVFGLTLGEMLLLSLIGTPLGIALGVWLARWMGDTVSFMSFAPRTPLPVSLQGLNWPLVGAALGVALLARLLPLHGAARQSVVEQAREGARPIRAPLWQRVYGDLILVAPTVYAFDQLSKRGTLALRAGDSPDELFQDPLLVLVPALFILTVALLSMRLFPWLMRLLDLLAARTTWLSLHLALRQLSRSSQHYINPLLLVLVALGMGVYTRTLANSLDQWMEDQLYYRVGADLTIRPLPPTGPDGQFVLPPDAVFIPRKDDFRQLPGVLDATRVGDFQARLLLSDRQYPARMLAIDREDFAQVAWFRRDFSSESLGGLMNLLALAPDNVLVTQAFLTDHRFHVGDRFNMRVTVGEGYSYLGSFRIAGVYNYFPTVSPGAPTIIGNLDHLFTEAGAEFPHLIWLRLAPTADHAALLQAITNRGVTPGNPQDVGALLAVEQAKMERVGIFGTLSVGFVAATIMAILALLVHSYAAMQERLYQFGVLRAIGLRHRQVIGQVASEYGVLTAYGTIAGALIGWAAAEQFAPFFRIPESAGAPPPPLLPLLEREAIWQFAAAFAGLMIVTEVVVLIVALRRRQFEALRIGHQG